MRKNCDTVMAKSRAEGRGKLSSPNALLSAGHSKCSTRDGQLGG